MSKKILLALGGNALGDGPKEQKEVVKYAAQAVVELAKEGHKVIICHGNGPQVGMVNNSFNEALSAGVIKENMPFPECGAMSQGYIGYHLQNAINEELSKNGLNNDCISIVTQTIVSKTDSAFKNPTKPIGPFLEEQEAKALAAKEGFKVIEDSGRGWRKVVPSPLPLNIKEINVVKKLFENNVITIAGGGGGIPVYKEGDKLVGVDAVIDKDFTSAKIAELTEADSFLILTAVDTIKINYGTPQQESLKEVSIAELNKYISDNQFAPGSMLPKIKALISFVESTGKDAYIGELKDALSIVKGEKGTRVKK